MAKKILIHTRNLSIPGGKQSYLIALQKYFESEVTYFNYGTSKEEKEPFFRFVRRFFGDYIDFYKVLRNEKFDIVHINTSFNLKSYFRDSIFTLISKVTRHRTIVFWHGWRWDFEKKYARKIPFYFHFTFGKADAMICLASSFLNSLKTYGYQNPIYLETTLVDDEIIDFKRGSNPLKLSKDKVTLLFLSRVERAKGIYETIDAFKKLKKRYPNLELTVAGIGSELNSVKKYVKENQISDVKFSGWVSGNKKVKVLYDSDIFILASYSEGMPICVLEAMVSGQPVITTDTGAIKDFFEEGKMGFKVISQNAVDIENKIEKFLIQPDLIKKMGSYNSQYARERFSAKEVCERLEKVYEEISMNRKEKKHH